MGLKINTAKNLKVLRNAFAKIINEVFLRVVKGLNFHSYILWIVN
jgi:hypothetical protein